MSKFLDFFLQLLSQFAGGPGPMENNLVRFGLPAILWGALLIVAWTRQRNQDLPREKLLVWGFGLGFGGALLMAVFVSLQMLEVIDREATYAILVPLDRAMAMASIVVIAGAFLRYILDDERVAYSYLLVGLGITITCLMIAFWQWPNYPSTLVGTSFQDTWGAWLFHLSSSALIVFAIVLLRREPSWLSDIVSLALMFFLIGELLLLANYFTERSYSSVICPIGNSFRILAVPLLGYVYLREQAIEKKQAERALEAYRDHLEDLVKERTNELTVVNTQLTQEVHDRRQAEEALQQLGRRYETILESAGEGICGIDHLGRFIFVNRAAAKMLGYSVDELVGQPCHPIWHHSQADDSPYPEDKCPIYAGYTHGIASHGDEQYFWRRDHTSFPVRYVSSPTYEEGRLTGTVVVFRDITERKRAEAEIAQHNVNLAAQNAVAATLSRSLELETILDTTLGVVLSVMDMETGLIFLVDPDGGELTLQSSRGPIVQEKAQKSEGGPNAYVAISAQAVISLQTIAQAGSSSLDRPSISGSAGEGPETLVSVPLISKGRAVGALTLGSQRAEPIGQSELELLTAIGQQIGMAIENARLYWMAERSAEMLTLLHQVSIVLTSTFDPAEIYDQMAEQSVKLLGCQMACILTWNEEEQRVEYVSSYGLNEAEHHHLSTELNTSSSPHDLITCHPSMAIDEAQSDMRIPLPWREKLGVRALLCVPIKGTEGLLGTLFLMDRRAARHWKSVELELIESFVNRAAVALINANLHKQMEWAAALEERQRIAADIHDGLAQTVGILGLRVDGAMELLNTGADREALQELSDIRDTVEQVSAEVRRSITSLHQPPQPRRSLQKMLSDLLGQLPMEDSPAIDFAFRVEEPLFLPPEQAVEALLVVQEALVNARRHAHARRISLGLERREREVHLTVEDDGRGFDPSEWWKNSQDHFGLSIMHARAARIGGRLQIDSAPGQGTRVILIVPLNGYGHETQFNAIQ